jgi:hypothetical protein
MDESSHLNATLNTWQLWGIAVGLVISGEYFGWSYGWASAGTLGFLATTILVATMYTAFIFSFTELLSIASVMTSGMRHLPYIHCKLSGRRLRFVLSDLQRASPAACGAPP